MQIKFALVDITAEPSLASNQDIKAYPTFRLFLNGKFAVDYLGSRKFK